MFLYEIHKHGFDVCRRMCVSFFPFARFTANQVRFIIYWKINMHIFMMHKLHSSVQGPTNSFFLFVFNSFVGATIAEELIRTTLSIVEVLSQHYALISTYHSIVSL